MGNSNKFDNFETSDRMLELLLKDALEGYEEDIAEVDDFLNQVRLGIGSSKMGLEQYGIQLNEALKTKGATRDRLIKVINMVAQRVRVKESASKGDDITGSSMSPEAILKLTDEIRKQAKAKVKAVEEDIAKDDDPI